MLERAFEPFFTTKPVGKGTGLGLSQIHGFAAQAGGRAEIESALGEGTTVRLLFPLRPTKPTAAAASDEAPASRGDGAHGPAGRGQRPGPRLRRAACSPSSTIGCSAPTCGDQALELLASEKVDLLFTDVVMPGISGVELARLAREKLPGLPVLLASGYSEEIARGAARAFETLAKPYGAQSLGTALGAARARAPQDSPAA